MDSQLLYVKGTRVWVPDEKSVWIGAILLADICNNQIELALEDGREVVIDLNSLNLPPLRNPDILLGANDLTTLSYLHEPAGIVLVALNPYQSIPIYSNDMISAYSGQPIGEMDPHIFAIAEDAFRNMVNLGKNQSIIVSGESGAGKTVSAKYTMRYFANVGGSTVETAVEQKVLASNPIMEAIGNAKTIRNDNSSRFGKYIEINFSEAFHISGAHMRTYLLEKSRVVYQATDERNYHIFYQMCASRELPELQELNLKGAEEFFYTQQGENTEIPGVDDQACFQDTCDAMALLGIYSEQQRMIWRILAAILHLGNIDIEKISKSKDECYIKQDDFSALMVSSLLGVDGNQLRKWLCARKIIATGDVYVKPLLWQEANNGRDALAKHIYSQLFKWIVEHINVNLAMTSQRRSCIGVLDIYGFETFEVNSFEQFCINYANEKLQQQFNQHVFKLEQEEYVREEINWSFIDFYDNQPCIDLIETKLGILDLLDEECRMPKGADKSWAMKLYKQHLQKSRHFVKPRMSDVAFIIRHYADDVIYDCNGFVEKNRDLINEEHLSLLRASEYELVGELFQTQDAASLYVPRKRTSSRVGSNAPKAKKTVGSEFRDSLKKLMEALNSTSPNYVRCIKSNDEKKPFVLNLHRCVQQLRACGVLETVRISAAGYPSRWTYEEFFDRYRMLISWQSINWDSLHGTCHVILKNHIPDADKFQLGKTKIFFRAGAVAYLERLRSEKLRDSCIMIQKNVKCWLASRKYQRLKRCTIRIQAFVRGYQARCLAQFLRETRAATRIQTKWRGYTLRKKFLGIRECVITVQSFIRGAMARAKLRHMIQERKSVVIQKYWRGYVERKKYRHTVKMIIFMQCCVRRKAARKEFKQLKIQARSVEHFKSLNKGMEKKVMTLQEKLTEESKEKEQLKVKVDELISMEEEVHKLRMIRPQWEELIKSSDQLKSTNEKLICEIQSTKENEERVLAESKQIQLDKDEEIARLRAMLEITQKELKEEKQNFIEEQEKHQEILQAQLSEQKAVLVLEFDQERASHQKMLGEYARLEQRFSNLQEELKIEKNSPEKRRRSIREEMVGADVPVHDQVRTLSSELVDVTRERDMLLEQVELLKEEQSISLNLPRISDVTDTKKEVANQNEILANENDKLKKQMAVLSLAIQEDEEENLEKQDRVVSKLLKQIEELRVENSNLHRNKNKPVVVEPVITPSNVSDVAQKEISRLTMENLELREELDRVKAQLKEALSRTITSPPRTGMFNRNEKGLSPRSKSNVAELVRNRSTTFGSRMEDGNLSEAGKLLMTYAGLMRKKPLQTGKVTTPNGTVINRVGMLQFNASQQEDVVTKLVTDMKPCYVEKEIPGLPAHIIFMAIRYVDHINDERLMQSYLTTVISTIKKRVTNVPGDIDMQAFWLSNTYRLFCNMKQFSGEQQFQSLNTREQNESCLTNFDLSEYRQVLSDTCVKIYQDMAANIQSRITNLIVPGMLEYESIPGVVSTLRRFKSERKETEEIITVKDITNKLSAILSVLNAHCLHPSLIKQIFRQIYYYISATMVNNILLRKDMCHWSRGLQIKFNLTQLEEWCRTNQLHENINLVEQLDPITEVVQLLQVNKKSLSDVDGIVPLISKLNSLQVQKILSMYTPPNEYEPRVPGNLIKAVVSKLKKTDHAYLMLDLKFIVPMNVPYVSSTVNFDKLNIPSELQMNEYKIL